METSITDQLQTSAVRDLAWALEGPSLIDGAAAEILGRFVSDAELQAKLKKALPRLLALDREPRVLEEFVAVHRENNRLGNYFESLLAFSLENLLEARDLRFRIPIRDARRTLGELDFVFRDEASGEWEHWEATVKFYLRTGSDLASCYGIDPTDNLHLKLRRTLDHQLTLPGRPETQAILARYGVPLLRSRALMKGILFDPKPDPLRAPLDLGPLPPPIAPGRARGWWARAGEVWWETMERESYWVVLPKYRWLSPIRTSSREELLKGETLIENLLLHFGEGTSPQMLARMEHRNDAWHEVERGLVVGHDFPRLSPSRV